MWIWKSGIRLLMMILVNVVGVPVRKRAIGHNEVCLRIIG